MARYALMSCLTLTLAACGGGKVSVGYPKPISCPMKVPDAVPFDGSGPAPGSLVIIEPGDDSPSPSTSTAYEIDPKSRKIRRQITDKPERLGGMVIIVVTNPKDNAGTLLVAGNPPRPPNPPGPIYDRLNGYIDAFYGPLPPDTSCEQLQQYK